MRKYKCKIEDTTNDAGIEDFGLTHSELIEYLKNEDFIVHEAERIHADSEYIKEKIEEKLQEAHRDILSHHDLRSGDISPLEQEVMIEKTNKLVEETESWIEGRLQ